MDLPRPQSWALGLALTEMDWSDPNPRRSCGGVGKPMSTGSLRPSSRLARHSDPASDAPEFLAIVRQLSESHTHNSWTRAFDRRNTSWDLVATEVFDCRFRCFTRQSLIRVCMRAWWTPALKFYQDSASYDNMTARSTHAAPPVGPIQSVKSSAVTTLKRRH